jgi:hypothetical protein
MKKIITALFFATLLLGACKSSKEASSKAKKTNQESTIEKWIIAGEKANCSETSTEQCYQVKKFGSSSYEILDVVIEGFNYEAGYKYQIEVKIVPSLKEGAKYIFVAETVKIASE